MALRLYTIALTTVAAVLPHFNMLDTVALRDMSVTYSEPNFHGIATYLLENRKVAACYPLGTSNTATDARGFPSGIQIASLQICGESASCHFFVGANCKDYSVKVDEGDAANVETPAGNVFRSYSCGCEKESISAVGGVNFTLPMISRNSTEGLKW